MRNGSSSNKAHNILFGRGDDGEGPRTRHETLTVHGEGDRCPEFIVICARSAPSGISNKSIGDEFGQPASIE